MSELNVFDLRSVNDLGLLVERCVASGIES